MILFQSNVNINKEKEYILGNNRIEMLEKTLRLIGNFDKTKPIIIDDSEITQYNDIIYTTKDKDDTTFSFINFDIEKENYNQTRHAKNFHLTMQRKNSKIEYIYDFFNIEKKLDIIDELKIIELKEKLSEERKISIKIIENETINLEVEENDKVYIISLVIQDKNNFNYIGKFEYIRNIISKLEYINLENILKAINEKVSSCFIKKQEKTIVTIHFYDNKLYYYEYNSDNEIITTIVSNNIVRTTEKNTPNGKINNKEIIAIENCDRIKKEAKMLLKIR